MNPKRKNKDTLYDISLAQIVPSPLETQTRRREKFKAEEIDSLGISIRKSGLRQPILVRPRENSEKGETGETEYFEIVFGERRWRGSQSAGLKTIKCFVEELTDAATVELQYEENHRRQEPDALDDAFTFKYLQEREGYTEDMLADRFATTLRNVRDKLRLNDLIPEAVKELEDGSLPLKHAYYLSRFPTQAQMEIVKKQYAYRFADWTEGAVPFDEFRQEVEENIVRRLSDAPFDPEDKRLHLKGLKCSDCHERTGFEPMLFPELARSDSCLNQQCFSFKTNVHLRLMREEIAANLPNPENAPLEDKVKEVPLVTERVWTGESPFNQKVLTNQKIFDAAECVFSMPSLVVAGAKKGQQAYTCGQKNCEIHNPEPSRVEVEFDRQVAHRVRVAVFTEALEWFDGSKTFWQFNDLVKRLIHTFLSEISAESDDIFFIIRDWAGAPKGVVKGARLSSFVEGLDIRRQSQLLFLLAYKDELFCPLSAESEILTVSLAAEYTRLDYVLLDAEARLELAPAEFKQECLEYLENVRNGIPCDAPRFRQVTDDGDEKIRACEHGANSGEKSPQPNAG